MKSIIKNILTPFILSTSLLLVGCMPDSLTKFKEDAPKKKEADGGIIIAPPPETCTPGTPDGGYCTPLSGVSYASISSNELKIEINTSNFGKPISTIAPNLFPAGNNAIDYTSFSISPALPTGLSFNPNTGAISGTPALAHARTLHTVTATHVNYPSAPVQFQFYLSVGTRIGSLEYLTPGFSEAGNSPVRLIVGLGETTSAVGTPLQPKFTVTSGNTPNISTSQGARGMVRYINYTANEIFLEAHNILSENSFRDTADVDSSSSYFTSKGKIAGVTIGFPSLRSMMGQLSVAPSGNRILLRPAISPITATSFLSNEVDLIRYAVSPSFPSNLGISLNTTTGNIEWTPGTVIGTPSYDPKIEREYYTIYAMNTNGQVVANTIRLSIQDVAAAKSISDIYYPQTAGSNIILKVSSVAPFQPKERLTGTLNLTAANPIVTGNSTNFQAELTVGSRFVVNNSVYEVLSVNSATSVTLTTAPSESGANLIARPLNSPISGFYDGGTALDSRDDVKVRGLIHTIDTSSSELYVTISGPIEQGIFAKPDQGFSIGMKLFNGTNYQYELATVTDVIATIDIENADNATIGAPVVLKDLYLYPLHQASGALSPEDIEQIDTLTIEATPNMSAISGALFLGQHGSISASGQLVETTTNIINYNIKNAFGRTINKSLKMRLLRKPTMSLTKQAIIALKASEYPLNNILQTFQLGTTISSPISAPSTEVKKAKVKEIFSVDDEVLLLVDIVNGNFQQGDALDNWRLYATERARIQRVIPISHKITLNTTAPASFINNIVNFTSGAEGKVVLVNGSNIFVLQTNDGEIGTNDIVTYTPPIGAPVTRTVTQIHSNHLKFSLSYTAPTPMRLNFYQTIPSSLNVGNTVNFSSGAVGTITSIESQKKAMEITLTSGEVNPEDTIPASSLTVAAVIYPYEAGHYIINTQLGGTHGATGRGMINRLTGPSRTGATEVGVSVDYGYFAQGFNVSHTNSERALASTGSITSSPQTENMFTLYRGQETTININLLKGENSKFSIYPSLPLGLTIDEANLMIKGRPTDAKARTLYTLTATNGLGSSEFKFYLRVNSIFEILEQTEARSPILHLSGRHAHTKPCLITDDMIKSNNTTIDCHLDVGELDIEFYGANFHSNTSAGICSYVSYTPYSFYKKEPKTTAMIYLRRAGDSSTCDSLVDQFGNTIDLSVIPPNTYLLQDGESPTCFGNYPQHNLNCDNGSYRLITHTYTEVEPANPGDPVVECRFTETVTQAQCGGNPGQCIGGAVRDAFTSAQINSGIRTAVVASENGLNTNANSSDSIFKVNRTIGTISTLQAANFTYNNSCESPTDPWAYRTDDWYNINRNSIGYADPFKTEFPHYSFRCLDNASSTVAEIKIKIREWDMDFIGRAPFLPASGSSMGSFFDFTRIKPQSFMSESPSEDQRHGWDSRSEDYHSFPKLSPGVEPVDSPARFPAAFCSPTQHYTSLVNPASIVSTVVTISDTSNIMELGTTFPSAAVGDLLVVQNPSTLRFSYFTIEALSPTFDSFVVSRPRRTIDSFSSGQVNNVFIVPSDRRIRFPLDSGVLAQ